MRTTMKVGIFSFQDPDQYLSGTTFKDSYHHIPCHRELESGELAALTPEDLTHFLFHLDVTYTDSFPLDRAGFIQYMDDRGIIVLNRRAQDISKTRLQQACLMSRLPVLVASPQGDPEELLIVKTTANYGGFREAGIKKHFPQTNICPTHRDINTTRSYLVLRREEVPEPCWTDPSLTVERFITNKQHYFYKTYFCWDKTVISQIVDPEPIKKMPTGVPRLDKFFDPEEKEDFQTYREIRYTLAQIRQLMGVDFGTADFVQDDNGRFYIVDINTTPWWGEEHTQIPDFLRRGLESQLQAT